MINFPVLTRDHVDLDILLDPEDWPWTYKFYKFRIPSKKSYERPLNHEIRIPI